MNENFSSIGKVVNNDTKKEFSDSIIKQKIGIVKILSGLEEFLKTSPKIEIDEINTIIERNKDQFTLTENQIELLKNGVEQYFEKHNTIKNYIEKYQKEIGNNWQREFFKDCFGVYPKGEIRLREGQITLYWQCEDLSDYALAANLSIEEAKKTFGFRKSPLDNYLEGLRGTIIIEWSGHPKHKIQTLEKKDEKSKVTEIHEEQHIIFDMLPDEVNYSGLGFQELNEESELDQISEGVDNYFETRRQEMERATKNEILAYWKDGEKTLDEIESIVLEKGGNYDLRGLETEGKLRAYLISRFGNKYKRHIPHLGISKKWEEECKSYEITIKNAIQVLKKANLSFSEKKREFVYLFGIEPLSKWKRTFELCKDKI